MAKLHIKNRYGVTPQEVLNHTGLSWKAKGIYGYIQSKPENWDFAIERFEGKDGKDSTRSGVQELEHFGYLTREKKRQYNGTWDIEYTLYESPEDNPNHSGKPATADPPTMADNPTADNPTADNPTADNPPTIKDIPIKTEVVKQIDILTFWNSKKIIEHRDSTPIKNAIQSAKKNFSEEEVIQAINNYSLILHSEKTYFEHKWTLTEFLTKKNALPVFLYKQENDYLRIEHGKTPPQDFKKIKQETLDREKKAEEDKRKEQEENDRRKREDDKILRWLESLPESKKEEIENEISNNHMVTRLRLPAEDAPESEKESRMNMINGAKRTVRITLARKYYFQENQRTTIV